MPDIEGLALVRFYRASNATRNTPIIVLSSTEDPVIKASAFNLGANDYIVKLPDKLELIARIRYHSQAYVNLLERNAAFAALEVSEKRMAHEMANRRAVRFIADARADGNAAEDRLAIYPQHGTRRRLARILSARRRTLRVLSAGCDWSRSRVGSARCIGQQRASKPCRRRSRSRTARSGTGRTESNVPDGRTGRPHIHDVVRRL
jgi:DNA-binding NarL/FixJ family response regulator